jgi:hypothetical protein
MSELEIDIQTFHSLANASVEFWFLFLGPEISFAFAARSSRYDFRSSPPNFLRLYIKVV